MVQILSLELRTLILLPSFYMAISPLRNSYILHGISPLSFFAIYISFFHFFSICCFADCSSSFSLLRCFPGALIFGALYMLPPPVFFSYCYPGNSFPASCFGPGEGLLFSHFLLYSSDLRQLSWFILA